MRDNVYVTQQVEMSNGELTIKDWSRTIFVSPLHGKMTAFSLATVMANVFGPVSMAQINTDKYGYPTGNKLKDNENSLKTDAFSDINDNAIQLQNSIFSFVYQKAHKAEQQSASNAVNLPSAQLSSKFQFHSLLL
jgi:hypothetical protein